MHVVDGPLVDYYTSCVADLQRSGFHGLILALVRDADAPTFYDDLLRYWNSINDLTGRHLVFAVAGGSAAERVGVGAIHGGGYYSEHMALAERNTFGIKQLRLMAGPRRNVEPLLANLGDANTAQITALCDHLNVHERDLPCLHVTHLGSGRCQVLPLTAAPGATVYTTCKNIVAQLQSALRAFDQASFSGPSERPTYFQARLSERPDYTPSGVRQLVDLCQDHARAAEDFGKAAAMLKELALIPRLDQKARRMLNLAFSEQAMRFDADDHKKAEDIDRRQALAQSITELEAQLRDLRLQEARASAQERATIDKLQEPARRAIAEAFEALRRPMPDGSSSFRPFTRRTFPELRNTARHKPDAARQTSHFPNSHRR
jgi:hypothetical protein